MAYVSSITLYHLEDTAVWKRLKARRFCLQFQCSGFLVCFYHIARTAAVYACALHDRKQFGFLSEADMVEIASDHVTLGTDYGSCDGKGGRGQRSSLIITGDRETEILIKNANDERRAVSRRGVVTVVILTAINLLNYTDRCTVAGQSYRLPQKQSYTLENFSNLEFRCIAVSKTPTLVRRVFWGPSVVYKVETLPSLILFTCLMHNEPTGPASVNVFFFKFSPFSFQQTTAEQ